MCTQVVNSGNGKTIFSWSSSSLNIHLLYCRTFISAHCTKTKGGSSTYHRNRYRKRVPQRNKQHIQQDSRQNLSVRQSILSFLHSNVLGCNPAIQLCVSSFPPRPLPSQMRRQARLFIVVQPMA